MLRCKPPVEYRTGRFLTDTRDRGPRDLASAGLYSIDKHILNKHHFLPELQVHCLCWNVLFLADTMQVPGGTSVLLMLGHSEICCSAIGLRLIYISEPFVFSLKIQKHMSDTSITIFLNVLKASLCK